MEKNKKENTNIDTAEVNSLNESTTRRANFSVESQNTKPYDVNKMTGNSSNQSNNSEE